MSSEKCTKSKLNKLQRNSIIYFGSSKSFKTRRHTNENAKTKGFTVALILRIRIMLPSVHPSNSENVVFKWTCEVCVVLFFSYCIICRFYEIRNSTWRILAPLKEKMFRLHSNRISLGFYLLYWHPAWWSGDI